LRPFPTESSTSLRIPFPAFAAQKVFPGAYPFAMRHFTSLLLLSLALFTAAGAQAIHGRDGIKLPPPPSAEVDPVTDDYFGIKITDNYRWLEDGKSSRTRAFIDAENAYTARYMTQARIRPDVADDLDALERVSSWSLPIQRGGSLFFTRRLAGEEQASIYIRRSATAKPAAKPAAKDARLIDPAQLSRAPDTSVRIADVSPSGALLAYELRQGGADEASLHIVDTATGKTLEDELPPGLYRSVSFTPDGKGIYYARSNRQGTLLYLHTIGTRPSRDTLIFGREFHGEELGPVDVFTASVTDDGRYLVVDINRGIPARRVDIVFRDLAKPDAPFEDLVWGTDARFTAIYAAAGSRAKPAWYVLTDYKAPNGRILRADPGILPDFWQTIVPESTDVLQGFSIVGERIYAQHLHNVQPVTSVYALDGNSLGQLPDDGLGTASVLSGRTTDRLAFYSFESLIVPPTIFELDTVTGRRQVFAQSRVPFDSSLYELTQAFYKSKDGTTVPIFIAGKRGLKRDGSERLLMIGYGGFNLSMTPVWNPVYAWWLQQGGWFAIPNLRGGGEFGENWHRQAIFEHKQNVFDDWFAAAEYLIANKYTSPAHFAITGRSNGGLLMGASITQRPELFAAVVCGYPLLDMLRFQKFLQGPQWTSEYGSAENETQFRYLLKYSPYQNVKAGGHYPSVLFFTGDFDTRVDPLHARKMTALLQAVSAGDRPILLHYSLNGGHSAGVGVGQQIQDDADQLTFLWTESGR
jgi:prolyl oligopeptidase